MQNDKYKNCLIDLAKEIKEQAKEAKKDAESASSEEINYKNGYLMAYHTIVSLIKHQTLIFGIKQEEVGLEDIDPEKDLI